MKFLPFENLIFKTGLDKYQVLNLMKAFIRDNGYEGRLTETGFSIRRSILFYRNSFLPRIEGRVYEEDGQAMVHVKMRLSIVVLIFMCFWCVGVLSAFATILIHSLYVGKFDAGIFIPLGMFLLGYVLAVGGFKSESIGSKKDLIQLFDVKPQVQA